MLLKVDGTSVNLKKEKKATYKSFTKFNEILDNFSKILGNFDKTVLINARGQLC